MRANLLTVDQKTYLEMYPEQSDYNGIDGMDNLQTYAFKQEGMKR